MQTARQASVPEGNRSKRQTKAFKVGKALLALALLPFLLTFLLSSLGPPWSIGLGFLFLPGVFLFFLGLILIIWGRLEFTGKASSIVAVVVTAFLSLPILWLIKEVFLYFWYKWVREGFRGIREPLFFLGVIFIYVIVLVFGILYYNQRIM